MSKQLILLRDVICKYHPVFLTNPDFHKIALEYPQMFNVEHLIEETLAAVGGYKLVNEAGRDFTDNSDSKTVTLIQHGKTWSGMIRDVQNKIGSLRVTIYNPFKNRVDFMYIPHQAINWHKERAYGKTHESKRLIRIYWNQVSDSYNDFNPYRMLSFQKLAQATG